MIGFSRAVVRIGVVDQGFGRTPDYLALLPESTTVEVLDWREQRDPHLDAAAYDALVLCGGDDVHARHFGAENHPTVVLDDARRDAYEIALCRRVAALGVPMLGVCRGMQVLNIALGGDIVQHLSELPGSAEHAGGITHALRLGEDSQVARAAGDDGARPTVNSFHHQAVGRIAKGLRATAWSDDGTVEAIEGPGRFCVGAQWHPEREGNDPALGARLFKSLVAAARRS